MVERGEFFEYAVVHGDLKGTAREPVQKTLAQGKDVLLEIDWQGAEQVRKKMRDTVSIFILPPSRAELERRLRSRASDSEETILRRLADVRRDLEHAADFDYVVVNDNFDSALDEICSIVEHRRRQAAAPKRDHSALLADLLRI